MVLCSLLSLQFHVFDAVNAMLLNEFLKSTTVKQQRKDLEAAIARDQKQIEAFMVGLRAGKAQIERSRFNPQTTAAILNVARIIPPVHVSFCHCSAESKRSRNSD